VFEVDSDVMLMPSYSLRYTTTCISRLAVTRRSLSTVQYNNARHKGLPSVAVDDQRFKTTRTIKETDIVPTKLEVQRCIGIE